MKNQAHAFNPSLEDSQAVATSSDLTLAELVEQIQSTEAYADVSIREEAAEAIFAAMEQRGVTRIELARRLGKNRSYITKVLSGDENLSIETLSKIFRALDCQFRIEYSLSSAPSPLWTPPLEAKSSSVRCLSGGTPLNWKPMSNAQLTLVPDQTGRWKDEVLALS